jgi:phenylacetate-coenzyme A ligase PaaK-like adenylate-forming protein
MTDQWIHKIFDVTKSGFEALALEIFSFQYQNNTVYRDFTDALHIIPPNVKVLGQIPFLPVKCYKSADITCTAFNPEKIFESSGTTGMVNSRHLVKDISFYEKSFTGGFEQFYGPIDNWCIIGLLPSYLERGNSSLVYMVDRLIKKSQHPMSGFYPDDYEKLGVTLHSLEQQQQKTILIGVTFALVDFAEQYPMKLDYTTIMETGGMKGRRKEIVRNELHELLKNAFGVPAIHSEYGMTELLSQAYSEGDGLFRAPPWMKLMCRDDEDPLMVTDKGTGALNIIDLANIYSCSFIATDDAGRIHEDGSFEVIGRIDGSDLRGCSLLSFR